MAGYSGSRLEYLTRGGGQNPDISTAKPQIKKPPSSSFRYCLPEYVCKISWSNSKKRREEFPGTQFLAFNLNQPVIPSSFPVRNGLLNVEPCLLFLQKFLYFCETFFTFCGTFLTLCGASLTFCGTILHFLRNLLTSCGAFFTFSPPFVPPPLPQYFEG